MKTIVGHIREHRLQPVIQASKRIYGTENSIDIQSYQLAKFNNLWGKIQRNVPFYRQLVQDQFVPNDIRTWDDFVKLPILSRKSIQNDLPQYIDCTQQITGWSVTGGSTGTPFRFPYTAQKIHPPMLNAWIGRDFYNIQVSDRMFHFWGHSHLFGNGWQRYIKQAKRLLRNNLLGYQTFSAYHLTPKRLRCAGEAIKKMRPDYIMGYSRSLTMLARENAEQATTFQQLPIKAIIATTEAFSQAEDIRLIEQVFGCPVAMEYGAAETGVIAYTHPADQRYRVFWDVYLIEAVPIDESDAKLLITALYPCVMPLIRYDIGDIVHNYDVSSNSIVGFDSILGRDNDLIKFDNGSFVHSVGLIHCIQSQQGVLGVQAIQEKDKSIVINIMCNTPLSAKAEGTIRRNLATLNPALSTCTIHYVDQLEQTTAGKTRWIIKR